MVCSRGDSVAMWFEADSVTGFPAGWFVGEVHIRKRNETVAVLFLDESGEDDTVCIMADTDPCLRLMTGPGGSRPAASAAPKRKRASRQEQESRSSGQRARRASKRSDSFDFDSVSEDDDGGDDECIAD
jgi:hypothetical protein